MSRHRHIRWIVHRYKEHWVFVVIMVILTLLTSLVSIAYPYVFKSIIDLLSDILARPELYPQPMADVYKILWLFLAIGLAHFVADFYPCIRAVVNLRFEHSLRMHYFTDITRKDYRFFQSYRSGDIVTRLTDDISDFPKISWFLCSGIFRAFNSFSMILFSLVVMASINLKLTLLSIAPLPLMMLVYYFASEKLYTNFERNQAAISDINSQLEKSFSGIRIIKSFVSEEKYQRYFDIALAKRFKTEMSMVKLNAVLDLVFQYIDYFAQISVIIFGGLMAIKGEISMGTFFLFYTYLSMMIYPLLDLPQLFVSGKQAFVNIDRLEEMKAYPTFNKPDDFGQKIEEFQSLSFDKVSFFYPQKDEPILKELSFILRPQERLLILGATGSGKSTVANLIVGLLPASAGRILVNGQDIANIKIKSFRDALAFVPQEASLFSGSIRENVMMARAEADEADYRQAIQSAQLESEIAAFPLGDESPVGNRGLEVSGGQKQRITIARALIKKPKLLILDDITASLDAENEEKLWQAIDSHYPDTAAIVISHRLSTLRYVDKILFLDAEGRGHLGSHAELVYKNKEYHDFLHEHLKE